jgi:hypothetical protein
MTSFLNFHAFAAARGDGLRPELHALFERSAAAPRSELTEKRASATEYQCFNSRLTDRRISNDNR